MLFTAESTEVKNFNSLDSNPCLLTSLTNKSVSTTFQLILTLSSITLRAK